MGLQRHGAHIPVITPTHIGVRDHHLLTKIRYKRTKKFLLTRKRIQPNGLKEVLIKVSKRYEGKKIYITENGIADSRDYIRPYFILSHINAIKESRVNVKAYMYWSLIDNFEWNFGYEMKFGLYDINLKPRSRAILFKNLKNF